jgi:hypothetical protein
MKSSTLILLALLSNSNAISQTQTDIKKRLSPLSLPTLSNKTTLPSLSDKTTLPSLSDKTTLPSLLEKDSIPAKKESPVEITAPKTTTSDLKTPNGAEMKVELNKLPMPTI